MTREERRGGNREVVLLTKVTPDCNFHGMMGCMMEVAPGAGPWMPIKAMAAISRRQ